jgi:hypothetical protein
MLVPNINSKRCHKGRTFGLMFMVLDSLVESETGFLRLNLDWPAPAGRCGEPVAPIAKKYRIVAMVTMRRQADFSRVGRISKLLASDRRQALAANRATT